jgi:hypothetical protein
MFKIIIGAFLVAVLVSSSIALFFWKFLLGIMISLIPTSAAYAWLGKLACYVIIGAFGGITLPITSFVAIMMIGLGIAGSLD